MWKSNLTRQTFSMESGCYRLTDLGRACVDVVDTDETVGSLTRHLHDVLMLCGTTIWFEQLRQFMPPRTLEESLRSLLKLGLIEMIHPDRDTEQAAWLPTQAWVPASQPMRLRMFARA